MEDPKVDERLEEQERQEQYVESSYSFNEQSEPW